jgi:dolichol-phosphate mannosyltransferase
VLPTYPRRIRFEVLNVCASNPLSELRQLLITIATYNELENLPRLIDELFVRFPEAQILVVDDNSPDGTPHWLAEQTQINNRLHAIVRDSKLGLGTAARQALLWGLEKDFEFVATMDADFSHDPADLLRLNSRIASTSADVVIGSRYVAGGKIEGWSWFRRVSSRLINIHSRLWLGLKTRDNSSALRIYRGSVLRTIDVSKLQSRGYVYLQELLWRLQYSDASVAEVPITFRDRVRGKSKINSREAFAAVVTIIRLAFAKP